MCILYGHVIVMRNSDDEHSKQTAAMILQSTQG